MAELRLKATFAKVAKYSSGKVAQQCCNEDNPNEKCELYYPVKNSSSGKIEPIATCEKPATANILCTIQVTVPLVGDVNIIKSMSEKLNASGLSFQVRHCSSIEALGQLIDSGAKITIKPEARDDLIQRYNKPPNNTQDNLDALNQLLTKFDQQNTQHQNTRKKF